MKTYPQAKIDVVEIDPALTALARQYFNLRDDPRLKIYHEDGRTFLNKTKYKYDAIFGDAMNSLYSIPFQLTTQETAYKMYEMLNDDGVVIDNISDGSEVQNIMLVALKSAERPLFENSDPELNKYLKNLWTKEVQKDMPVLTDDYAPVDNYIMKIIKGL